MNSCNYLSSQNYCMTLQISLIEPKSAEFMVVWQCKTVEADRTNERNRDRLCGLHPKGTLSFLLQFQSTTKLMVQLLSHLYFSQEGVTQINTNIMKYVHTDKYSASFLQIIPLLILLVSPFSYYFEFRSE